MRATTAKTQYLCCHTSQKVISTLLDWSARLLVQRDILLGHSGGCGHGRKRTQPERHVAIFESAQKEGEDRIRIGPKVRIQQNGRGTPRSFRLLPSCLSHRPACGAQPLHVVVSDEHGTLQYPSFKGVEVSARECEKLFWREAFEEFVG